MAERKAPARKAASGSTPKKAAAKKAPVKAAPTKQPVPDDESTSSRSTKLTDAATDPNYHDGDGVVGVTPDDTPNEHYTLSGVITGKPVPEHNR